MNNTLFCGDNLDILQKDIEKESVDLIYIDPPFFSHKQYEVIWGDEAEIRSFEDRWGGDIENYIAWMKPRIEAMYEALKPTGSFYLHCDWHANAHLRILCDKIFGKENFRNEIIWHYRTGNLAKNQFQRKHDNIYFYSKTDQIKFNPLEIKEYYTEVYGPGFKPSFEGRKQGKDEKGIYRMSMIDDVWNISAIFTMSKEHLGYPTQKPEALLDRIIKASSNEGDTVLDAFCGCGTALAVAHRLKRNWIGVDISSTAVKLIEKRLRIVGAVKNEHYTVIGEPKTIPELQKLKPFEFQNWVISEMPGARASKKKTGDMGLDGHIPKSLLHEEAGIQVKQSEGIGRNVVDNFKSALDREKHKKGYIIAFSFGRGAKEEVARLKNKGEIDIELITVEELLNKRKAH